MRSAPLLRSKMWLESSLRSARPEPKRSIAQGNIPAAKHSVSFLVLPNHSQYNADRFGYWHHDCTFVSRLHNRLVPSKASWLAAFLPARTMVSQHASKATSFIHMAPALLHERLRDQNIQNLQETYIDVTRSARDLVPVPRRTDGMSHLS